MTLKIISNTTKNPQMAHSSRKSRC